MDTLLNTSTYQNLTVNQAVARWAPPSQNDTPAYQAAVTAAIGATGDTPMSALSPGQLETMEAVIAQREGFNVQGTKTITGGSIPW